MEMITVLNIVILLYSQLGQAPPLPCYPVNVLSTAKVIQNLCPLGRNWLPWRPEGTDVSQRPNHARKEE